MTKISITLPSIYPDALSRTLKNLDAATTMNNSLEIIVIAPAEIIARFTSLGKNEIDGELIWVEDKIKSGNIAAHYAGSLRATGDFIFAWVDDHSLIPSWDQIAVSNYEANEARNLHAKPYVLGLRQIPQRQHIGTVFGIYYPYFPFMRREHLELIGGWLSPEFKSGFGDCDLGLRVWLAGGLCEWAEQATINVEPDDQTNKAPINASGMSNALEQDMQTFIKKWGSTYGPGWDIANLRGFNIDLPVDQMPHQFTFFRNKR